MEPQGQKNKKRSSSSLIKRKVQSAAICLDTPPPTTASGGGGEQPEFTVTLRCRVNWYTKGGPKLRSERTYRGDDAEASFVAGDPSDVPRDADDVRAVMRSLLRAITPLQHLDLTDDEWEAILPEDVVPELGDLARGGGGAAAVVELEVDRHVRYSAPRVLLTGCREAAAGEEAGGECSICYEALLEKAAGGGVAVELPGCAHAFHRRCISKWFGKKPTCPLCRGDVTRHLEPELRMHLDVVFGH